MPESIRKSSSLNRRQALFLGLMIAWVAAVVMTDRAVPLTPPVVPYAVTAAH